MSVGIKLAAAADATSSVLGKRPHDQSFGKGAADRTDEAPKKPSLLASKQKLVAAPSAPATATAGRLGGQLSYALAMAKKVQQQVGANSYEVGGKNSTSGKKKIDSRYLSFKSLLLAVPRFGKPTADGAINMSIRTLIPANIGTQLSVADPRTAEMVRTPTGDTELAMIRYKTTGSGKQTEYHPQYNDERQRLVIGQSLTVSRYVRAAHKTDDADYELKPFVPCTFEGIRLAHKVFPNGDEKDQYKITAVGTEYSAKDPANYILDEVHKYFPPGALQYEPLTELPPTMMIAAEEPAGAPEPPKDQVVNGQATVCSVPSRPPAGSSAASSSGSNSNSAPAAPAAGAAGATAAQTKVFNQAYSDWWQRRSPRLIASHGNIVIWPTTTHIPIGESTLSPEHGQIQERVVYGKESEDPETDKWSTKRTKENTATGQPVDIRLPRLTVDIFGKQWSQSIQVRNLSAVMPPEGVGMDEERQALIDQEEALTPDQSQFGTERFLLMCEMSPEAAAGILCTHNYLAFKKVGVSHLTEARMLMALSATGEQDKTFQNQANTDSAKEFRKKHNVDVVCNYMAWDALPDLPRHVALYGYPITREAVISIIRAKHAKDGEIDEQYYAIPFIKPAPLQDFAKSVSRHCESYFPHMRNIFCTSKPFITCEGMKSSEYYIALTPVPLTPSLRDSLCEEHKINQMNIDEQAEFFSRIFLDPSAHPLAQKIGVRGMLDDITDRALFYAMNKNIYLLRNAEAAERWLAYEQAQNAVAAYTEEEDNESTHGVESNGASGSDVDHDEEFEPEEDAPMEDVE